MLTLYLADGEYPALLLWVGWSELNHTTSLEAISYPESSGFLVSSDSGVLEFSYRKISAVKQWKSLQGSQSNNLDFFEFPRVSTGAHPLTKKPEDSGYEIALEVDFHSLLRRGSAEKSECRRKIPRKATSSETSTIRNVKASLRSANIYSTADRGVGV